MMIKSYTTFLILEDGHFCQGFSFIGSSSLISIGEVVFNTGMTGYQEILTDPSYCDQIVLFTYPELGNTGVNMIDMESNRPYIKGLVAKNLCLNFSNWQTKISLISYLVKYRIPHIFGIDTRYLTKYLRSKGAMIGCILNYSLGFELLQSSIDQFKLSKKLHLIDRVTTKKIYKWLPKFVNNINYYTKYKYKANSLNVIVIDYGVKFNILNRLIFYGCSVTVVPARTSYEAIIAEQPHGILLSNGPGDPSLINNTITKIDQLIRSNIPIFGICLGHQLLSLALGAKTNKLKFGHRGLNHPSGLYNFVKMTSQNHGYVVSINTLPKNILDIVDVNLNDNTVSCILHQYKPCFAVQYHPEASPGPHDSDYLFAHFVKVMSMCKLS